jgi:hypothetical protein
VIGSKKLLEKMVKAGWLKPVVKGHSLTIYARKDVEAAFARLEAGEYPEVNGGV